MTGSVLTFSRDYEFSPVIVWDALIDADLVSGWLGDADIDPVAGGRYDIRWLGRAGSPITVGRITELAERELLEVDLVDDGSFRIGLAALPGGNRGTSSRLVIQVSTPVESAFTAQLQADWLTSLDQLGELLHGHPVNWTHWERDRHEGWLRHLGQVRNSSA
jgi:uncharacterized protein YndB with AHSA1/START domain